MDNKYNYKDRGMLKYLSFNALETFLSSVDDHIEEKSKVKKPILSADQFSELDYNIKKLKNELPKEVLIKFYDNGFIKFIRGFVNEININEKDIIINNNKIIFNNILEILY